MKRFAAVVILTLLACVTAGLIAYYMHTRQDPAEWVGRKLGLEGIKLTEFTAAHNEYVVSCAEMCRRIEEVNDVLADQLMVKQEVTPDVIAILSRAESLRAECKQNMLTHFMKVAELLDKEKQSKYMQLVMPLITERDQMEKSHEHHRP
ncbi:MAG TPA: hypothetical protein PJ991_05790 [Kiritimatiellia bacterium]|nr:hypothetical protein [Kiritimatiellia bacterium]